ncbi:hypothetical protein [Nibricoccus sp. IMCC34717]|uniref:hypothetical protein n=1 Tax=Nibricoccus sp. IMCC34717 TaxID=3034021 RepID=UPI00384D65B1
MPHSPLRGNALRCALLWLVLTASLFAGPFETVLVEDSKTSIYVGSVTLRLSPLKRDGDRYVGDYNAKVFPFFFTSEHGTLHVDCTQEQLDALQRGERVPFTGGGTSFDGEARQVEGHVTPDGPNSTSGNIKVRIFVSRKIQIVFNTTYRFAP